MAKRYSNIKQAPSSPPFESRTIFTQITKKHLLVLFFDAPIFVMPALAGAQYHCALSVRHGVLKSEAFAATSSYVR